MSIPKGWHKHWWVMLGLNHQSREILVMGFDPDYDSANRKARIRAATEEPFASSVFLLDIMNTRSSGIAMENWLMGEGFEKSEAHEAVRSVAGQLARDMKRMRD